MKRFFKLIQKKFYFLIWLIWLSSATMPSNDKVEALLKAGAKNFAAENFHEASLYYKKVLELDFQNLEATYQLAECYRNLFDYQNAMHFYADALHHDEAHQFPLAGLYLGIMQRSNGLFEKSSRTLQQFIRFATDKKFKDYHSFVDKAKLVEESNQFVLEKSMMPEGNFNFQRLPAPVNSGFNEYGPVIFKNDSCLLISSSRSGTKGNSYSQKFGDFYSDNFVFVKNQAAWENKTVPLGFAVLNTPADEGAGVFNQQKDKFFFTSCYQGNACQLLFTQFIQGKWTKPAPLPKPINLPGINSKQPAVTAQADTLYFSSDRPGGYGQHDLWMSTLDVKGNWTEPKNLGSVINTEQNEVAPFFDESDKTLFFSSNGHKSFGGYDILFVPKLQEPDVINLGPPFNSSKDDLYIHLGQSAGFLSSNRENADGNFDIYTFKLYTNEAEVVALENNEQKSELGAYLNVLQFFDEKDAQFYQELPMKDKMMVRNYMEKQSLQKALADQSALKGDLQYVYEQLPTEEKNRIERIATAKKSFLMKENQDPISKEDYFYYENLPSQKKEQISQLVEAKVFENIMIDQSEDNAQLAHYFEELPLEEKEQINRGIETRRKFIAKNLQDNATIEDLYLYQSLPEEDKKKFDEAEQDPYLYETLPAEEQKRLARLFNARNFAKKVVHDETEGFASDNNDSFSLETLTFNNPEKVKIQGVVTKNKLVAHRVPVLLKDKNGTQTSETNEDGIFTFADIKYKKDLKILFDFSSLKFTEVTQYALEELTITVLEDTVIKETFDNIYFDKNMSVLNDSAKIILDSLAEFHEKYPDVQVKIIAYTDSTGSHQHNIMLSEKRALEVKNYLTLHGVDQAILTLDPRGEDRTTMGSDLQYGRRIEFKIESVSSAYNPTREVYIIQPKPNLAEIADRFHIPLHELETMNEGIVFKPFTPVRVVQQRKK